MAINSILFVSIFSIFYLIYTQLGKSGFLRTALLLLFNLFFYWMVSNKGIFVLLFLGFSDFLIAKRISNSTVELTRKFLLYLSITINIGLILTFRHFTDWFHMTDYAQWPKVIGVSFFVFRSMGYVLDVYRETIDKPETNVLHYITWLSFFPLILAGPISPARDFLGELKTGFKAAEIQVNKALFLLGTGIVKKFIISNYLAANFVDRVFESSSYFTAVENLMAIIGQALVVYLDFSGYTDLMIGLALLLGFNIKENFNFPYLATNITDYWRRWHMSLSSWLNEYLFFPLNFALRGLKKWGTILSVLVTFGISGFWHGTALHYTFWGLLHGFALSWDVLTNQLRDKVKSIIPNRVYNSFSILLTFAFLCFSGVFFKAADLTVGKNMILKVFTQMDLLYFNKWAQVYPWILAAIILVLVMQWSLSAFYDKIIRFAESLHFSILTVWLVAIIFVAFQFSRMSSMPFIYLEF